MKSIKEKQMLLKWAKAMKEPIDPKLEEEVKRYETLQADVLKSVKENTISDLAEASKVAVNLVEKISIDYPKPPTIDELLSILEEQKEEIEEIKEVVKKVEEETETQVVEENKQKPDLVSKAAELITKEVLLEKDSFQQPDPALTNKDIASIQKKLKFLEQAISKIAATGPGSGEVNFLRLDDVDTSQISDNKYLRYNAANSKIEFAEISSASSISSANVNDAGNLLITLSDANVIDAGYVIGPQGETGPQGASAGLRFLYNSGSGFQDPGDGNFSVNRDSTPTFTSTTRLIFSYQSADSIAVNTLISRWDDNTTQTNRGVVMISRADGTQQSWWSLTGAYAVAGTGFWNHTPATFLGGNTAFTNGEEYFVTFVRNGDKGNVGNTGESGIGVTNATVNESGNLVITLSDLTELDAGYVVGPRDISSNTTTDLAEGNNLYYTNARVSSNVVDYLLNAPNATIGNVVVVDTLTTPNFSVSETLTIGSQIIYAQGTNGFSVNEDFDPSANSLQTAYHYTSGAGRETVAFTLARTGQFTNGFGIYGTAADNKFVTFGEQSNTGFEWRRGIGIRPLDLDGGTLLANISPAGDMTVTGNIIASNFIGNVSASVDLTSVSSNIVPSANSVYNLGAPDYRWKTLYLANNTIDLGGALIQSDGTGAIIISSSGAILPRNSKVSIGEDQEQIALVNNTGSVVTIVPFYTQTQGLNNAATTLRFGANPDNFVFTNFTLNNGQSIQQAAVAQFYF